MIGFVREKTHTKGTAQGFVKMFLDGDFLIFVADFNLAQRLLLLRDVATAPASLGGRVPGGTVT